MRNVIKAIRRPGRAVEVLVERVLCAVGNTDFTRFLVLSRSRTGSTLLRSLLNSHPNVRADAEVFGTLDGRGHDEILDEVFAKQPYYVKAKGFKLFYYHPMDETCDALWEDLVDQDDLRVIHLKRRNILRTLVSRKIAGRQDVWHAPGEQASESGRKKAVEFTAEELEKGFSETRGWEAEGDETFARHPMISVDYEDLTGDPETTFRSITDFLGVPYVTPQTTLSKQNPEPLRDLLANFDELKATFAGTEWEPFFDE